MKWFPVRVTFVENGQIVDQWDDAIQAYTWPDAYRKAAWNWSADDSDNVIIDLLPSALH